MVRLAPLNIDISEFSASIFMTSGIKSGCVVRYPSRDTAGTEIVFGLGILSKGTVDILAFGAIVFMPQYLLPKSCSSTCAEDPSFRATFSVVMLVCQV